MAGPRETLLARLLVPALALMPLLAGCLTTPTPGAPPGGPAPGPEAPTVLYRPVCDISNWADACTVRASPNESPSKAEIDLAVNPLDPMNVVVGSKDLDRSASNCVWAVPQFTKDGGRTWETVILGGTRQERMADPQNPLFGWECITDPIMAFDEDGILYYPLQAYNTASGGPTCPHEGAVGMLPIGLLAGCGSAFLLARSGDGGATYDRIIPMAVGDGSVVFHDYPRMLVNPATGTVSTVWNAIGNAGGNPWVVSTRDQGESVEGPVIVAAPDAPRTTFFASGFAADREGTVFMTITKLSVQDFLAFAAGQGPETLPVHLAVSRDDARSFGGFARIFEVTPIDCPLPNSEFRCGTRIELAADTSGGPRDGRLYAVWDDGRNGNADIFAAWSDDDGATWSEPVRVNQDNTTHAQWMPRAEVGPDGTLHILYLDRQHDPGDKLYDATHAWSLDGGATWHNQRITSASSDGDLGVHQNGFPFIGDYVGIDIVGDHVYLGFPSTVTGKAEIAVAHLVRTNATGAP